MYCSISNKKEMTLIGEKPEMRRKQEVERSSDVIRSIDGKRVRF